MSNRLTEDAIEQLAIEQLKELGYHYLNGATIAPDGTQPKRKSYADVLLVGRVKAAIQKLNPTVVTSALSTAYRQIERLNAPDLIANNEAFHRLLTEGIPVSYQKDGHTRGDRVWLVDFENPKNNDYLVVNQFTVIENDINKRPDLILFVNGLPLVVIELKNAASENATVQSAYKQLQTYKAMIPTLFTYNGLLVISDGIDARAGSLSAGMSRFMAWKDGKSQDQALIPALEVMIRGMLNTTTLLDLIRHFTVFEKGRNEEEQTGIITIETVKKIAAYHQYAAVNKAVESTLRAVGYSDEEKPSQAKANRKAGVIWHTQGSGKSLSMVFYTGKIVLSLNNPTILVMTDRNDLDDQLFDTFAAAKQLLRQEPTQARNREHLKELLRVASGGVVFSTIQKFHPGEGNIYQTLSERENIIVIADEAHRTQYGFKAKTTSQKDQEGNEIGQKVRYGFAKYLRDALPNATFLGFTGTPIESSDQNTQRVFGDYIDIYDIAQSVEDGATVPIYYESRLAKVELTEEGRKLVKALDEELNEQELTQTQEDATHYMQLEALIGSEQRIKNIAHDIVTHFEQRQEVNSGKAMIVAMSRRIAAVLYNEIVVIRPDWHSDSLHQGKIKVIMTSNSSDGPKMAKHHTNKNQRRALASRMKDPKDELQLVIVRDMWLTGFDAPSMHTMYIDKPMKGHSLMQAIARVNRVYGDKPGGLIVDYLGIAGDLKEALAFYGKNGGKGDPALEQEQAVAIMLEKLEVVSQMYVGLDYKPYFAANTARKLRLILEAENHILGLEEGKKRYLREVTALSKAFALAVPHEKAMAVKDKVAFFQAVKARLVKFESTGTGKSNVEIQTAVRQVIDQALVSEQVIDIFDAAGLKKPDVSILSDEFLLEIKNMEHQNVALEVLKKLLADKIKTSAKKNLVQAKSLMEMLEQSLNRYHSKAITSAMVIEELINLGRLIRDSENDATQMGLTEYEYAFYTALANHENARQVMQKEKLRELAVVLTMKIKENTSIDWTIKSSVRAKLRTTVKRTLRKYGYPPDMQKLATETVLRQAELMAEELADT